MERQKRLLILAVAGLVVAGAAIAFVALRQRAANPETGERVNVTVESVKENLKNNNAFNQ